MILPLRHPALMMTGRLAGVWLVFFSWFHSHVLAEPPGNGEGGEGALRLPEWSEQELRAFRENSQGAAGAGILPPGNGGGSVTDINTLLNTPIPSDPRLQHAFDGSDAEISPRLRPEHMRLFLPEAILGQPPQSQTGSMRIPTPMPALKAVTPEFLTACNQALPTEYLIDPGMLIPEMQSQDLMRFMEFHARDARIKLYLLITAADRKLPEGVELGKIASGSLLQKDACLLVYPLGEPWRSRLFVNRSIHAQTSSEFLRETIQSCVNEAMQASDVHDQLHRYAVHLSTRLFWLQRALGPKSSQLEGKERSLTEVGSKDTPPSPQPPPGLSPTIIGCFGGLMGCGMCVFVGIRIRHRWQARQRNRVWMLPEPETIPRLGGAFTGGGGGMIRYS